MTTHRRTRLLVLAGIATATLALTSCSGDGGGDDAGDGGGGSGAPLSMWTRQVTATQSQALVDAWNKDHDQQVDLTIVPAENYLQKIGVAAGANELPCLMASDVVYAPNFIEKGLLADITDRVKALPFADALAPGHVDVSTMDDAVYMVPHTLAVSAIFQNNVLLEKAGIDPSARVESLAQLQENALTVAALGGDVTGFLYTSDSAGTLSFTMFPSIWASGGEALSEDGTESLLDSPEAVEVFEAFNEMWASGAAPTADSATGATRNEVFATGNVGYVLASNSVLEAVPESDTVQIGVQAIPGVDGGQSTFLGGDTIGISSSCEDPDGAWEFLEWSLGDEAQGIYSELNQLSVRTDLAASEDPRIARLNEIVADGRTPFALRYAETFNDPQGPALAVFREALFGSDPAGALKAGNQSITDSLQG
jgi:multiple sugar transport system substrate-binding protein